MKFIDTISIEKAIKNGELGENLAKRAQSFKNFSVKELKNLVLPYRLFAFEDGSGYYTILLEKNKLVILCKSFGRAGHAYNFSISNITGRKILYFDYQSGSRVAPTAHGQYNLGSGKSLVSDNN